MIAHGKDIKIFSGTSNLNRYIDAVFRHRIWLMCRHNNLDIRSLFISQFFHLIFFSLHFFISIGKKGIYETLVHKCPLPL